MSPLPPFSGTSGGPTSRRPPTIAELAQVALDALKHDPQAEFKPNLRAADRARKAAKVANEAGDLETAFIEYAKAATIILEKLPAHRDYTTILNPEQRHNLGLNGQDILDHLSALKPQLVQNHENWAAAHAAQQSSADKPDDARRKGKERESQQQAFQQQAQEAVDRRQKAEAEHRRAQEEMGRREAEHRQAEEAERLRRMESERARRAEAEKQGKVGDPDARAQAALAAARRAAHTTAAEPLIPINIPAFRPPEITRENSIEYHQQQAVIQREESVRRSEQRRQEQVGIMQRQRESEDAARTARQPPPSQPSPMNSSPQQYSNPDYGRAAPPIQYPSTTPSRVPPAQSLTSPYAATPQFPTQQPSGYPPPVSTPVRVPPKNRAGLYAPVEDMSSLTLTMPIESPTRMTHHVRSAAPKRTSFSYPQITTTSPAPDNAISYPEIMTMHQQKQGYTPSIRSMFMADAHGRPYPMQAMRAPAYPVAVPPPPPPPRQAPESRSASGKPKLREVNLPRESLHKFLSIAALNTARNQETCGLLLGRESDLNKFLVTCLLVPKQHSTSDTCSMDEEELVLDFTENRGLITLGWIHTHPSQSCFMSSVDLHTHSGFQQMLPESFAVVCAPKSTPNFGIFRLTDPAGLQTILECQAKEAFHPHPDMPIYTDADRGHVYMTDESIEIVDLR